MPTNVIHSTTVEETVFSDPESVVSYTPAPGAHQTRVKIEKAGSVHRVKAPRPGDDRRNRESKHHQSFVLHTAFTSLLVGLIMNGTLVLTGRSELKSWRYRLTPNTSAFLISSCVRVRS